MSKYRKPIAVAAAVAISSVTLAACGGGSGSSSGGGGGANTLYYLSYRPVEHWDPQRVYIGRDISNSGRLFYRSWVTNPVTTSASESSQVVPDLATDTGTSKKGGKEWSFTLKDGVKWQDGKAITCEDFAYGMSRTFATDVITGGPNYILGYLDIPTNADGSSKYSGPYTKKGQQYYDKAVSCKGKTITYKFKKPWPDFALAVASLRAFDPYREDQDQGNKSNYTIFSNGPYKVQGAWNEKTGGTFVRNNQWDQKTDDVRKPNVDKIVFKQGIDDEVIYNRLAADRGPDSYAVTDRNIPSAHYSEITGDVAARATLKKSPYVDYLLPNFKRLTNPKVRQALLMSTDDKAWIAAGGGEKAFSPARTMVNPVLVGYQPQPAFDARGDFAGAKKMLASAGEKLPYPIKFTYPQSDRADKQAAALQQGWQKAGFKVTLEPLGDTYYTVIQKPSQTNDVIWGGWGADWPSIGTVLPPLFDSRLNLTSKASNGQDYGNYKSDTVNNLFDKAAQQTSVDAQAKVYAQSDAALAKDVAYIPLEITNFYFLRGSNIGTYIQNPATSYYPDLGNISVKQ